MLAPPHQNTCAQPLKKVSKSCRARFSEFEYSANISSKYGRTDQGDR